MDRTRWNTIGSIVDEALDLPEKDWNMFVERRCTGDPAIRREVGRLLNSIKASEGLWDELFSSQESIIEDYAKNTISLTSGTADPKSFSVGAYELRKRIGHGGMGEVWQAERSDGQFEQRVAVKIVRPGTGLKEHYRRFRQERQILASLNHPNIAGLLDGGITEDGRPYLVMEYVDGVPITQFCNNHHCSLSQRLELFGKVCRAVQYAHSNLVVHRDLKPDNILVTEEGQLKVLDFGIAKLLDSDLTERTLIETRPGLRMMSLSYAAPEQVSMEPVTTATDVYALGLLLYELLSGVRPFDLKGKKLAEAERIIRDQDPIKPSQQASRWQKELKGDLDTIILKALRKEPERRYDSAAQLLEDIDRYGKNLPVLAGGETLGYRASKFIKRNRMAVAIAVVILVMSAGFGFYHTWQVTEERNIARMEAEKALRISTFLLQLFESANPDIVQGREVTARDLLESAREKVIALDDQPELQANLLKTFGNAYASLGYYEEGLELLHRAMKSHWQQNGERSPEVAALQFDIGMLHKDRRDFLTAISHLRRAAEIRRMLQSDSSVEMAVTLINLGEAMIQEGLIDSSKYVIEEGLSLLQKDLPPYHDYILRAKTGLAMIYRHEQNYEQAAALLKNNIDAVRIEEPPNLTVLIPNLNNLGYVQKLNGDYAAAEATYREAIELGTEVYGEDHPNVLMMSSNNLYSTLMRLNKFQEAERLLLRSAELHRRRFGTDHWRTGSALNSLGLFYFRTSSYSKAIPYFDESTAIFSKVLGPSHTWTGRTMAEKGVCLLAMGEHEEASRLFDKGFEIIIANKERINYNEKRDIDRLADLCEIAGDSGRAERIREFLKGQDIPD